MDPLVATLESAVRLLSSVTVTPDSTSKWTKNALFTQFKAEADNQRETLQARKRKRKRKRKGQ